MTQSYICVGKILGAHGLKGDVMVQAFTQDPAQLVSYGPYFTAQGEAEIPLTFKMHTSKGGVVFHHGASHDRNAATALRGTQLWVPRSVLQGQATEEDEFFYSDLVGLVWRNAQGEVLGVGTAVQDHGAGIYLEGERHDEKKGKKRCLTVPFTHQAVPEVHVQEGYIVVDPTYILD